MYEVVALGELLIDFAAYGMSEKQNPVFEANSGGAPCNALAMLAVLGKKVAFIGKVGNDMFGAQLKLALENAKISCEGLVLDSAFNTTLAFVSNKPDGDREFSFYRTNGADTQLKQDEIKQELIKKARLFHFGSLSLTHEPAKGATQLAVKIARDNSVLISFDPNLRPALWECMSNAREQIMWGMAQCNILKLSEEELFFVSDKRELKAAMNDILCSYPNIKLLTVTNGKHGSYAACKTAMAFCEASAHKAIDTTGAGDTFFGCCINSVLNIGIENFNEQELYNMLKFANTAAGIITTRKGALSNMPSLEEIEKG